MKLSGNKISGPFPTSLLSLDRLSTSRYWIGVHLSLWLSLILGVTYLSPLFYILERTAHLDLFDNLLTSSIPPEIGRLSNLLLFAAGSNKLRGHVPSELGRLTNLCELGPCVNDGPCRTFLRQSLSHTFSCEHRISHPCVAQLNCPCITIHSPAQSQKSWAT